MNLQDFRKPFAPDKISWRVGSTTKDKSKGMALAYIDARDVQDRLDEVCGIDNWQCRYVPMHDKKTVCEIGIRVFRAQGDVPPHHDWIWKSDGAGDSDIEAEKGALSDAFKRAAVRWGIGRYLYDLDSPWVELDTYEKNGTVYAKGIKQSEHAKLRALLAKDARTPASEAPKASTAASVDAPTDGHDGQLQAAVDKELATINACKTVGDLTEWLESMAYSGEERGDLVSPATNSRLYKLMKKSPDHFKVLRTAYLTRLTKVR